MSVKDQSIVYEKGFKYYKKVSKSILLKNEDYDSIVKTIKCVKNAICFIKDNIFICKHYDTIILKYDLSTKEFLILKFNCSLTSNNMLITCMDYLGYYDYDKYGNVWDLMKKYATSNEDQLRNNQYTNGISERIY